MSSVTGPGRARALLLGVALLALVVRAVVFVVNFGHAAPHVTTSDSYGFIWPAESLHAHLAIVDDHGARAWSRPPGMPMFLALLFAAGIASPAALGGAVLVQIALGAMVVVMATSIGRRMGGPLAGAAVGVLLAIEPSGVAYCNLILSETLYTFELIAALLVFWDWNATRSTLRLLFFAGLVGLLPLTRPVAWFLPPALAAFILIAGPDPLRRLRHATLFLVLALVPMISWSCRNRYALGSWELDETGPLAKAMFARSVEERLGGASVPSDTKQPWDPGFAEGLGVSVPLAMSIQERYFRDTIVHHPISALKELFVSGVMMVGVPDSQLAPQLTERPPAFVEGSVGGRLRWLFDLGPLSVLLLTGMLISTGGVIMMPILAWEIRRWSPELRSPSALIVLLIVYHLALGSFLRFQGERYRVPVIPLLALTCVVGLLHFTAARRAMPAAHVRGDTGGGDLARGALS